VTLTNFPNGISTSTISATTIDFPADGTVIADIGNIGTVTSTVDATDTLTATLGTVNTLVATVATANTLTLGTSTALTGMFVQNITLSPTAVAASTAGEQTFALTNVGTADIILSVNKPTAQAGLGLGGSRVSAAGSIGINFINASTAAVTPTASEVYKVAFLRHN
jgi:hypothetical protein